MLLSRADLFQTILAFVQAEASRDKEKRSLYTGRCFKALHRPERIISAAF